MLAQSLNKTQKTAQEERQIQSLYLNSITKTVYGYVDLNGQRIDPRGETSDGRIFADAGA